MSVVAESSKKKDWLVNVGSVSQPKELVGFLLSELPKVRPWANAAPGAIIPIARMSAASRTAFFFQAEDGIRDPSVTGVQTCALPISFEVFRADSSTACLSHGRIVRRSMISKEIGRASSRERVEISVGVVAFKKK